MVSRGSSPDRVSLAEQLTLTTWSTEYVLVGVVMAMAGGVRSTLMGPTTSKLVFPALSVAVLLTVWPTPSATNVVWPARLATPESWSEQANTTWTGVWYHPFALAGEVGLPVIVVAQSSARGR